MFTKNIVTFTGYSEIVRFISIVAGGWLTFSGSEGAVEDAVICGADESTVKFPRVNDSVLLSVS